MHTTALLRVFLGISASLELALPCFSLNLSDMGAYSTRQSDITGVALITTKSTVFDAKEIIARGGHGPPRPTPVLKMTDYSNNDIPAPDANAEPPSTADIKALSANKKQADALYQSGLKYEKSGNLKNAQISYYKALTIRNKIFGKKDPGITILTNRLGEVALKQKDWEYADKCFKELMKTQGVLHGPGAYGEIPYLLNLAKVEAGRKSFPEEIDYLDRALTLQERKDGTKAPECLSTRLSLIDATVDCSNWGDGEERLKQALDVEKSKDKTQTKEYLQLLKDGSKIMTGLKKESDASDYDRRAAELQTQLEKSTPATKVETKATPAAVTSKAKPASSAAKPKHSHRTAPKSSAKIVHPPKAAKKKP